MRLHQLGRRIFRVANLELGEQRAQRTVARIVTVGLRKRRSEGESRVLVRLGGGAVNMPATADRDRLLALLVLTRNEFV